MVLMLAIENLDLFLAFGKIVAWGCPFAKFVRSDVSLTCVRCCSDCGTGIPGGGGRGGRCGNRAARRADALHAAARAKQQTAEHVTSFLRNSSKLVPKIFVVDLNAASGTVQLQMALSLFVQCCVLVTH